MLKDIPCTSALAACALSLPYIMLCNVVLQTILSSVLRRAACCHATNQIQRYCGFRVRRRWDCCYRARALLHIVNGDVAILWGILQLLFACCCNVSWHCYSISWLLISSDVEMCCMQYSSVRAPSLPMLFLISTTAKEQQSGRKRGYKVWIEQKVNLAAVNARTARWHGKWGSLETKKSNWAVGTDSGSNNSENLD